MSITRVYRDRDNNIKVEKFSFEEVKKDLTKLLSHDNRIIGDSSLRYPIGLSQFKKLVLITMFGVATKERNKNETKRFIKHSADS
jgi:hypothetical protein